MPPNEPIANAQSTTNSEGPKPDPILEAINTLRESVDQRFESFDTRLGQYDEVNNLVRQAAEQAAANPASETPAGSWQPQKWDDFVELARKVGQEEASKIVQAREVEYTKQSQAAADQQAKINAEIDKQLSDLEKEGFLPKIQNQNNPQDPGKLAQKELLALGVFLETTNLSKVAQTLKQNHDAGYTFNVESNSWVKARLPGSYAPVGSSSAISGAPQSNGPNYDMIHKARNFDDLIAYAEARGL